MHVRWSPLLELNPVKDVSTVSPIGIWLLFTTSFTKSCTMCSKFPVQVTGSFWVRSDFCCQVILLISSLVSSFFSTSLPRIFKRGDHLASAAENEKNHVELPNWRMIANESFLHFSKYGGAPLKFLNTLNPSSRCINLFTQSSDFGSPAVYFFPLVLHFRRDRDALFWICLIWSFFNF